MAAIEGKESVQSHISDMLKILQQSLSGAVSSLPSPNPLDASDTTPSILPPTGGISLLDSKSEILLAYLQNLVFLLLLQVRQLSATSLPPDLKAEAVAENKTHQASVIKKLTELRVFLERGVRPLEGRLKYQIDKVLKAADDADRAQQHANPKYRQVDTRKSKISNKSTGRPDSDSNDEDSTGGEDEAKTGGESDGSGDIDELAYRPNLASFSNAATKKENAAEAQKNAISGDGIYRPPRIKPTALPEASTSRRAEREARRNKKSKAIDEFISAEMSSAPMAEPSIGSTIRDGGRKMTTYQDRAREAERTAYEETNLVRLPKESKKERAKRGGNRRAGYGGEEWKGLGEGADRIQRLTRKAREGEGMLQRSRKRGAVDDRPHGDSTTIGERFEKRQKKIASWKR
ncbi:hypothetical protein FQN57_006327 [Myotisia sp. PD_48]|nr:hypothetical protein FQN57_006327 [Myotisia sp. PD_48]